MTRRDWLAVFAAQGVPREKTARKSYIVLLSGETENNSERSLSRLAQELEGKHGMRCNILAADGKRDFPGLDALEDADLVVLFVQSLALPADQLNQIRSYMNAGKPIVALRTALRGFDNWKEFSADVLGASWQGDSRESTTEVKVTSDAANHPILKGVPSGFPSHASLYLVTPLSGGARPLLIGSSAGQSSPVAWARTHKGGRVFYTSLGHPDDFEQPGFRTLLVNAILWALGRN
jgi:type 1 glutamine amidotransferase